MCAGSVGALHVASRRAWAWTRAVPAGGSAAASWALTAAAEALVALVAPLVPRGAVGLGMAVRVAMAAVGGDRVVAVVNVSTVRGQNAAADAVALEGGKGGGGIRRGAKKSFPSD
ncbi:hypothetical protein ACP4OV_011915 [Aristida adscensionis]